MGIVLYSTGCPKCKVLKKKLEQLEVDFSLVENIDDLNKFADEHNIREAPFLVVDDEILDFKSAIKYLTKES